MALLAGKLYDPTTAVSKSTAALLAMTAFDTTNLRLTFTAPSNGNVLVHMTTNVTAGSATPWTPSVLLGVLESTTVRGRLAPNGNAQSIVGATTSFTALEALFLVTGLTSGTSYTWDAAYGVETLATGSAIKYGGPNDTTISTAFGGFAFEIWDTA
jgi:hypothetical protein